MIQYSKGLPEIDGDIMEVSVVTRNLWLHGGAEVLSWELWQNILDISIANAWGSLMNLTLGPKHHLATILSVVSILKIGYGSMLWINMAMDVLSKKDMAMDQCWISVEITQFMAALLRLPKLGTDC